MIHEIGNAKDCPDCYGTGEIVDYEMVVENRYDDITKMDYNRYYKKEQCKTCSGTGYVQLIHRINKTQQKSQMKQMPFYLIMLVLSLIYSCENKKQSVSIDNLIVGKWRMVEYGSSYVNALDTLCFTRTVS